MLGGQRLFFAANFSSEMHIGMFFNECPYHLFAFTALIAISGIKEVNATIVSFVQGFAGDFCIEWCTPLAA